MFSSQYFILITSLLSIVMCHLQKPLDFRERFLERKRQRQIKDQRIMVLDKYVLSNSETLDDITHYRIPKSSSTKWKKVKAIENDFRRLLAMDGMKYNYKRDLYWRTWRSLLSDTGADEFVCYKCNNPIQINSTGCQNCGMWQTIEEKPPPCPYEFFSLINDEKLCGANYTQYKDLNSTCPSVIKFSDMTATCDNPIETVWRFSRLYGVEESGNIICGGQDFCEIFTSYEIAPAHVIFRIINSTNDVMYSRIMKPNNNNYICIDDCGRFNPTTRKVSKTDKPLKLDLLTSRITKREDDVLNEIIEGVHMPTEATKIWNVLKKTTLSLSKIGGNYLFKQKSKIGKLKGQQKTLDSHKGFFEQFILGLVGSTTPQPNKSTSISLCQKLHKEADHVSFEEENEEYV